MDNVKNDRYYIQKIRNDLQFIVQHMKDVDIEELNANEILLDSMLFRMIQSVSYTHLFLDDAAYFYLLYAIEPDLESLDVLLIHRHLLPYYGVFHKV